MIAIGLMVVLSAASHKWGKKILCALEISHCEAEAKLIFLYPLHNVTT
jgi:hypothetical protein